MPRLAELCAPWFASSKRLNSYSTGTTRSSPMSYLAWRFAGLARYCMGVSPNCTALCTGVKTLKRCKNGTRRHLTQHRQTGRITNYVRPVFGETNSYLIIISIVARESTEESERKRSLETLLANSSTILKVRDSLASLFVFYFLLHTYLRYA